MADGREEEERGLEEQGAVGGEDVINDPIMAQVAVLLRGYVIKCINIEDPGRHVSPVDLGGRPNEQLNPQDEEIVEQLLKIAEGMNRNAELQRLISQVPSNCTQNLFMTVARSIFTDGINWGRVAALFHLAYKLIYKELITNHPENMKIIVSLCLQFIRENVHFWILRQGGWAVINGISQWRTAAVVASVVLVCGFVYYRSTK